MLRPENAVLAVVYRSRKDCYKIFLNSEYSMEDAERILQIYSGRVPHEYLMLAQAVAYLLGECDLVKGFH